MTGMGGKRSQQVSSMGAAKGSKRPSLARVAGRLNMELDYGGGTEFQLQASDLIPEQPCSGVSMFHPLALPIDLDLRCPCRPF